MKGRVMMLGMSLLIGGCVDVGQEEVRVALSVSGAAADGIEARNDWVVELTRADVAFGPMYACASANAGDNCEAARAEWRDSTVIDYLDPDEREIGELSGLEGQVRSLMYEIGFFFPLTDNEPRPTEAGLELDGASLRLSGVARREGVELAFKATVVAAANTPGRVAAATRITPEVLGPERTGIALAFDPEGLVEGIDFDLFLSENGELDTDEPIVFEPDTQAYRAVLNGLVAGARPEVTWR